ncbi:MAG: exodeoxyribonuclease VII large subunit [Verrucomicrobiaceae bacterium]|nr:exodeoxyribonuclease VII large subunit [Verrucomicrobiaceae bacterium]
MSDHVHTVAGITALLRENLEERFRGVWIEGEISNHRLPGSGHHYFTLKDPFAQLACVLFKGAAAKSPVRLSDGLQVRIYGNISVYEARGQYQLIAQTVQPKGYGDLQAKFEALKRRLEAEGLFDPAAKKPLPAFPRTIGIVTSPTSAAIRDMLNVLGRRAPWIRVLIHPVRVQGDGAAEEIAAGVRAFDEAKNIPRPDLVIVARGGGSIEDLWAFNEEVVARAIAASSLPVMSGVGHEIDFTIADFVADRREPTPSAAAENAVPDGFALRRHLGRLQDSLDAKTEHALAISSRHLQSLQRELAAREPGRRMRQWTQSLDYLGERIEAALSVRLSRCRGDLGSARRGLQALQPERELARRRERVLETGGRFDLAARRAFADRRRQLENLGTLMESLSPDSILRRGFSVTTDPSGRVVKSAGQVKAGEIIQTRFADGKISSVVE